MSTNKTQNYQLHSWLPQDEFHLTEINENFAALDAALKAEAQAAATGRTALNTAVGQRMRMVTGSYAGQCWDTSIPQASQPTQHIALGFKPKAVLVVNTYRGLSDTDMSYLAVENAATNDAVTLTDDGFTVVNILKKGAYMNYTKCYHYAAFY